MKRAVITIENGIVSVPASGNIWMSEYEIAALHIKGSKKLTFSRKWSLV